MRKTHWVVASLLGLLIRAGCHAPMKTTSSTDALRVSCTPSSDDDGALAVRVCIENTSDTTVHIFDSRRMPYVLEEEGDLLILYGVNPPDPTKDYFMIEIPATHPLPPGEQVKDEVSLTPLHLGDHYSLSRERNPAVTRHGTVTVRCEVGWGHTAIRPSPEEQHVRNISELLAWQKPSRSVAIQVELP